MRDDVNRVETATDKQVMEVQLRTLCDYWAEARRGRDMPDRANIDPRRIAPLLSNAFIAERIAPGVTRLRVAGMHLSELMGMEVRGMPLSSFIAPAARDAFALHLVDLFDRPARLRLELRGAAGAGRAGLRASLVMLPLRSDLGDVSRALGCLVTQGPVGRAPQRFDIVTCRITALDAPIQEDGGLRLLRGGLDPAVRAPRCEPSHLRLVT